MTGTAETITAYEGFALLELMGHRQRVGYVREVEMFGGKLLRIDIPTEGGDVTEFYSAASIYALRPASEEVCRDAAKGYGDPRPIKPVEYRLPRLADHRLADGDDHHDDDDDMPV